MRILSIISLLVAVSASVFVFSVLRNQSTQGELSGTLSREGEEFVIEGTVLDIGPWRYVSTAPAPADYDLDGAIETMEIELDGLVGTVVTVQDLSPEQDSSLDLEGFWKRIRRGDFSLHDDGKFDVHVINGIEYRNPDEPPPWSNDATPEGTN